MDIQLNLATPQAENITLDEVIFSQAITELTFSVTPSDKTLVDGLSCALLTPQGKTLAHALTNANKAVLDTSTVECFEYVQGLPIEGAKDAYIVIGESTKPLAIVSVQVAKNYLADVAPPTATAPIYPTSQELQAILATLQEAIDRVGEIENIVEGFDEEVQEGINQINTATTDGVESINALVDGFDTTVQEAVTQVTNATQSGTEAINATTQQGATYLDSITNQGTTTITNATNTATNTITNATTQATTTIDNKVDAFNTILEQDRQEIADAVIEAEDARDEAETARDEASTSASNASTSASNASTSATQATNAKDATVAIKNELQDSIETIDELNDFVKHTNYNTFVQMVCNALSINYPSTGRPLNIVYTMENGWTIVEIAVPNNTAYLCVFDADWNLLFSRQRSGSVASNLASVCEEVNGIAYVINKNNTCTTIAIGDDGAPNVSEETAINLNGLVSNVFIKEPRDYVFIHSQVLGKYILFDKIIFDTSTLSVVATLSSDFDRQWKGLDNGATYATVNRIFQKFSLDDNGEVVVTSVSTKNVDCLVLKSGIYGEYYNGFDGYRLLQGTTYDTITTSAYGIGYVSNPMGMRSGYSPPAIASGSPMYHLATKAIIGTRTDGDFGAILPLAKHYNYYPWFVREVRLASKDTFEFRDASSDIHPRVLGVDSKGIWLSYGQTASWVMYHIQNKVVRVLWEDLK